MFIRRGAFLRRVNGGESLADATVAYLQRPGDEQQIAHPRDGGDACTVLKLSESVLESVVGHTRISTFVDPAIDVAHRRLLSLCATIDDSEFIERSLRIAAAALTRGGAPVATAGTRRRTRELRRRLVAEARLALHERPGATLPELARSAAVSPYHLSRLFRAETGQTVSQYRNQLRACLVLERLAAGEDNLARLAADADFADHAHLTRTLRTLTGSTPSALRRLLATAQGCSSAAAPPRAH